MGYDVSEPGVPTVNRESCVVCGQCAEICPTDALVVEDGEVRVGTGSFLGCFGCGHCMMACPTGSISVTGRRFSPEDVVELPPADQFATADQLDGLLLARRSVRRFDDRAIERKKVQRIVEMIATAPMGVPPSEVGLVVFHGREKVRQFTEDAIAAFRKGIRFFNPVVLTLMRPFMGKAQHALIRGFVRPVMELIVRKWEEGQDTFTYDAPLAIVFHRTPRGDQADTFIAATYAVLAAQSLGLGSCLLGTTVALDNDAGFKAKHGIPKKNKVNLGLVAGYPDVSFQRGVRRRLASVRFA